MGLLGRANTWSNQEKEARKTRSSHCELFTVAGVYYVWVGSSVRQEPDDGGCAQITKGLEYALQKMFSLSSKQQNHGKTSLQNDSGGWIDKMAQGEKQLIKLGQVRYLQNSGKEVCTREMERESREIFGLKLQALVDRRDIYFFVFTIHIWSLQKSVSSLNAWGKIHNPVNRPSKITNKQS